MTGELVKVDRVGSVGEAVALERLGVSHIGVSIDPDPRFDDGRTVTVDEAAAIGAALRRATLVTALDLGREPDRARHTGATLVQPITAATPAADARAALADAGLAIVRAGIEIAHDDDPAWVFGGLDDAALFQVDVLPEYRDSWRFLRDESPRFPDEFQIADLNDLTRERPLLVALDFTPANTPEIRAALPAARGIAFTLAEHARRGGVRFHAYAEVVRVIAAR